MSVCDVMRPDSACIAIPFGCEVRDVVLILDSAFSDIYIPRYVSLLSLSQILRDVV